MTYDEAEKWLDSHGGAFGNERATDDHGRVIVRIGEVERSCLYDWALIGSALDRALQAAFIAACVELRAYVGS